MTGPNSVGPKSTETDGRLRVQHRAMVTQQAFEVALPFGLPAGLRDATVVGHRELAHLGGTARRAVPAIHAAAVGQDANRAAGHAHQRR